MTTLKNEATPKRTYGECECGRTIRVGAAMLVPFTSLAGPGEAWEIVCARCGDADDSGFVVLRLLPQVEVLS